MESPRLVFTVDGAPAIAGIENSPAIVALLDQRLTKLNHDAGGDIVPGAVVVERDQFAALMKALAGAHSWRDLAHDVVHETRQAAPIASEFVTVTQAAALLGMNPSTVRRRCSAGRYAGVRRPGHAWLLPLTEVLSDEGART